MPAVAEPQVMQCMEVWGGNASADNNVVVAGLDAWVYSKPYGGSDGGGDVYYVSSCAMGRIVRLLLADVSGHGEAVKSLALDLRGLMRRSVNQLDQTQFVRTMNSQFAAMAQAGLFATAVVSTFFAPTRRLTLCNAGHPIPLLYRAAKRQWSFLESADSRPSADPVNLPLGIIDLADYQTFDVSLQVGDLVLCYTDSLVESYRCDGDEMLGHEGLMEIVRTVDVSDASRFISALLAAVGEQCKGNLTNDDVTVMLFRPNGTGHRRPTLVRQVIALGQMIGAVARSMRRDGAPVPWPDFKLPNIGGAVFPPLQRFWQARKS